MMKDVILRNDTKYLKEEDEIIGGIGHIDCACVYNSDPANPYRSPTNGSNTML